MSVIRWVVRRGGSPKRWLATQVRRKPKMVAAVALANKMARMIWALHRCLQRHGISRLPDVEGDKPKRQRFKRYPIGFFHIDSSELQTADGKRYLFVGIDRISKFAVTQLAGKSGLQDRVGVSRISAQGYPLTDPHDPHR